jgi:hypothetical protein
MNPAPQDTTFPRPLRAAASLALATAGLLWGGCSMASTGREAYFASRANAVMFGPGSGETRVSVGPDTAFGTDMALTDASDAAPRALGGER